VAREASDMILADDNFASIVAAIREGRGIFENIRKSLVYLLVGNVAELAVMLGAATFGLPLPLLPLHLLWINLVTDGFPALALVMEPVEQDAMRHPPRDPKEPLLGAPQWRFIAMVGALETVVTLGVFAWALGARDETEARTLAFSVLVYTELFRSFAARSPGRLFWEVGAFTNLRLVLVVAFSALLQVGLHQLELTRRLFELSVLPWQDGLLALGLGLISVSLIEVAKLIRRRASRSSRPGTP
jgi:Ca2+-transporting ATPase